MSFCAKAPPLASAPRAPCLAASVFYNRRDPAQFPAALPADADTLAYGVGFLSRYHSIPGDAPWAPMPAASGRGCMGASTRATITAPSRT